MSSDSRAAMTVFFLVCFAVGVAISTYDWAYGNQTYVWIPDPGDCKIETNGVEYRVVTLTESGEWRPLERSSPLDVNIFRDIYSARRYMAENRPRHEWR